MAQAGDYYYELETPLMMLFTPAAYMGDKYLLKRQTSVLQAAVVLLVLVATIGNVLVILSVQAPSTLHKSYYHTCTNHTIGTSTNHTIGTSTFHLPQINSQHNAMPTKFIQLTCDNATLSCNFK